MTSVYSALDIKQFKFKKCKYIAPSVIKRHVQDI